MTAIVWKLIGPAQLVVSAGGLTISICIWHVAHGWRLTSESAIMWFLAWKIR